MTELARSLPPGLAAIVTDFELHQPTVVSLADIAALSQQAGLKTPPSIVADRLRRHGWLLATGQRGMYEFAPGAHAGPYGHGDPFLVFRAALALQATRATINFEAAIALQSALWLHGLSDRTPNQHELAAAPQAAVPQAVRREMRVVRYQARLEPDLINGLPVHQAASLLVHLAAKPASVRNWAVFADALPDLVSLSSRPSNGGAESETTSNVSGETSLQIELQGRSAATKTRLAYLLSGVAPEISDRLQPQPATGVVYFGSRGPTRRFNSRFNIADTILPFDPSEIPALGEAA